MAGSFLTVTDTTAPVVLDKAAATRNLILATWTFTICFWAWNLIAPLGSLANEVLGLTPTQNSILVATPILVGSVGRIPVGALTDRFGGRTMFAVVTLATIVPVLLVAGAGFRLSFTGLVAAGFLLGIAGTAFAVGIPFVNAWFEPEHRGMATGVFGAGMVGTALSAFFTPRFVEWFGYRQTHWIIAAALLITGLVVLAWMTNSPRWHPNTEPVVPKLLDAARMPVTWAMSALYAVTFGGFVAFSTYLPTYLSNIYDFATTEAGSRTAGFAIAAVVARPIGGTLSDRVHPRLVMIGSLVGASVIHLQIIDNDKPPPEIPAGLSFMLMAFFLGVGTGATFAWVALDTPVEKVGSVAGIVGAAGGLGGYFPPLVMGATYNEAANNYTVGLVLLLATLIATLAFVFFGLRTDTPKEVPG